MNIARDKERKKRGSIIILYGFRCKIKVIGGCAASTIYHQPLVVLFKHHFSSHSKPHTMKNEMLLPSPFSSIVLHLFPSSLSSPWFILNLLSHRSLFSLYLFFCCVVIEVKIPSQYFGSHSFIAYIFFDTYVESLCSVVSKTFSWHRSLASSFLSLLCNSAPYSSFLFQIASRFILSSFICVPLSSHPYILLFFLFLLLLLVLLFVYFSSSFLLLLLLLFLGFFVLLLLIVQPSLILFFLFLQLPDRPCIGSLRHTSLTGSSLHQPFVGTMRFLGWLNSSVMERNFHAVPPIYPH